MGRKYYTLDEISCMKFRELPNFLHDAILKEIQKLYGASSYIEAIFDNAPVLDLDQYCNLWAHIELI